MQFSRIPKFCPGCDRLFFVEVSRGHQQFCSRDCLDNPWRHIDFAGPAGCWIWVNGDDTKDGRGRIRVDGQVYYAHRWVYEDLIDPIPEGMILDHWCWNPPWVNPAHMRIVTHQVNVATGPRVMSARLSETCKHGHLWTEANTYRHPRGSRICRACTAAAQTRYHERKSA